MTSRRLRSRRKAQSVNFVFYFFYYSLTSLYDYSLASLYEVFFHVQYSELPICISNLVLRQRAHLLFLDIYIAQAIPLLWAVAFRPPPEPLTPLGPLRRKFGFTLISRRGGVVVYTRQSRITGLQD